MVVASTAIVIFLYDKDDILFYISGLLMSFLLGNIIFINSARNFGEKIKFEITLDQYLILVILISTMTVFIIMNLLETDHLYAYLLNISFGSYILIRV
jgi:hypothetical protein